MPSVTMTTMELKEQTLAPALSRKLGEVPHVSEWLRHVEQLSGHAERVAGMVILQPDQKTK